MKTAQRRRYHPGNMSRICQIIAARRPCGASNQLVYTKSRQTWVPPGQALRWATDALAQLILTKPCPNRSNPPRRQGKALRATASPIDPRIGPGFPAVTGEQGQGNLYQPPTPSVIRKPFASLIQYYVRFALDYPPHVQREQFRLRVKQTR